MEKIEEKIGDGPSRPAGLLNKWFWGVLGKRIFTLFLMRGHVEGVKKNVVIKREVLDTESAESRGLLERDAELICGSEGEGEGDI